MDLLGKAWCTFVSARSVCTRFVPCDGSTFVLTFLTTNSFERSPVTPVRTSPIVPGVCKSSFCAPTIASAKSSLVLFDNDDLIIPEVIVNDKLSSSSNRNKFGIIASSAVMLAIVALGVPMVSNASPIAEITSIAGGASASTSAWLDSLSDSGFYQAFSLVFLSEIGDKTFFVAALLAAKLSRFISFVGSLGALAVMTVISVIIGQVFHSVPAGIANGVPLDDVAAVLAFTYFGIKILSEAFESDDGGKSAMDEEFEDAEETVEGSDTITKSSAG